MQTVSALPIKNETSQDVTLQWQLSNRTHESRFKIPAKNALKSSINESEKLRALIISDAQDSYQEYILPLGETAATITLLHHASTGVYVQYKTADRCEFLESTKPSPMGVVTLMRALKDHVLHARSAL